MNKRLIIDLSDETGELSSEEINIVEDLLQFAAEAEQTKDGAEVSVTFTDNSRIQDINREYRDKDQPTDVISFAMEEQGEDEIEIIGADMPPVLGDIIISVERTREQAADYGHSFKRELGFLAVHGFLHLLGYDHLTEEDEKEMFTKQKGILDSYGLTRSENI